MFDLPKESKDAKIYKLTSPNIDKIFVGVTTLTLDQKLKQHHSDYDRYKNRLLVTDISPFEILKAGSAIITLIEEITYTELSELQKRQLFWINDLHANNEVLPYRNPSEISDEPTNGESVYDMLWSNL